MEDILVPYKCLEQTVALAESRPSTQHEWVEWGHQVHELKDCGPRIEPIEVDQTASNDEQQLQVWEGVLSQISAVGQQTAIANAPPPVSDYLNPDWSEIWKDLLNHGGRQDNEKWPGDFSWTPRADDFDPKGFFPDSSRNGSTQFTNWLPKPAATPVSGDGSPPGLTRDYIMNWSRLQQDLQRRSLEDSINMGLTGYPAMDPYASAFHEPFIGLNFPSAPGEMPEEILEFYRRLTVAAGDARSPMQQMIDSLGFTKTEVGDLGATVFETGPAWQMMNESVNQGAIAYDLLGGRMQENQKVSFDWGKGLLSDAQAVGNDVPPEFDRVGVGISGVTDNYLALQATLLNFPNLPLIPQAIWAWGQRGAGASSSGRSASATADVDQDALDEVGLYGTRPEDIPAAIDEARNLAVHGATERERKLAEKRLKVLRQQRFELGGVVPGPIGAPVPALLHGGERVLRSGQPGGGPLNVTLHVHGNVVSERELVRNVREGLIRLNREVTEMGF